ncbi:MAG: hypothetical protein LBS76_02365 [Mycoplasmataceae bacterium]|jgi:hypothetical protein|nr:hypothetical protein [Mycoplasmataceae bacterium]
MSYNKKDKMIKIEQYEQDPNREGHEIKVSVLTKKSPKPPIIDPKPKSKTTKELLLEFMVETRNRFDTIEMTQKESNSQINTRLDSIETRLTNVETKLVEHDKRFEKIETTQKEQSILLQTVIKLNNLRTE